nr:hypothetical protein [Tanacetum cinerariifolium]
MSNDQSSKEHTEVSTLNFLGLFKSKPVTKTPPSPNDDEEGSPNRDGRVHQPVLGSNIDQPRHDEDNSATPIDEHNTFESNVGLNEEVPSFQNILPNITKEVGPKRVLKYLKLAHGLGVDFSKRKSECLITAFSDLDWAKCLITIRVRVYGFHYL